MAGEGGVSPEEAGIDPKIPESQVGLNSEMTQISQEARALFPKHLQTPKDELVSLMDENHPFNDTGFGETMYGIDNPLTLYPDRLIIHLGAGAVKGVGSGSVRLDNFSSTDEMVKRYGIKGSNVLYVGVHSDEVTQDKYGNPTENYGFSRGTTFVFSESGAVIKIVNLPMNAKDSREWPQNSKNQSEAPGRKITSVKVDIEKSDLPVIQQSLDAIKKKMQEVKNSGRYQAHRSTMKSSTTVAA